MAKALPEILQYARLQLMKHRPYLTNILLRMTPVPRPGLGTLAVDKWWRFYYDPEIDKKMTPKEAIMAIYHEVHHIIRQHATRHAWMSEQNSKLGNICTDLSINSDIRDERWPDSDIKLPDWVLQPEQFDLPPKETPEYYFDELSKKQQQQQQQQGGQSGGGGGGQDDEDDSGGGSGDQGEEDESGSSGGSRGKGGKSKQSGGGKGSESQQGDSGSGGGHQHQDGPIRPGTGQCGSVAGGPRREWELPDPEKSNVPGVGEIEAEVILNDVAKAISDYAKTRGDVPGGLKRWADEHLKPSKVDWRKRLGALIRRSVAIASGQTDYSLRRPSRRSMQRGIITPGTVRPVPEIAVVLDTSGSMTDRDIATALAEVQGILKKIGVPQLWLIDVDMEAGKPKKVSTVKKITLHGGGGTDMRVGIDEALKLKPRPNAIVVLTDGYTPWPSEPPPVPVIVGLVAGDVEVPKWAEKVLIGN